MKKYTISIQGYGAEVTVGSVEGELKEILSNTEKELIDIVTEDLDDYGGWNEVDDQLHRWGAAGTYRIEVIDDESMQTVFKIDSESLTDYDTEDFDLVEYDWFEPREDQDSLMCISFEKGCFFEGKIETDCDFDVRRLKIRITGDVCIDGYTYGDIVSRLLYDGEEIENYGGDTVGKAFEAYKNF